MPYALLTGWARDAMGFEVGRPRDAAGQVAGALREGGYHGSRSAWRSRDRKRMSSGVMDRVRTAGHMDARFTALLHRVTVDRLRAGYRGAEPASRAGIDGRRGRLPVRQGRAPRRARKASLRGRTEPARGSRIPKVDGRSRPLTIGALEDKMSSGRRPGPWTRQTADLGPVDSQPEGRSRPRRARVASVKRHRLDSYVLRPRLRLPTG